MLYEEENHSICNATHCIASRRGEENQRKSGGKIIKGHGAIYTPEQKRNFNISNHWTFCSKIEKLTYWVAKLNLVFIIRCKDHSLVDSKIWFQAIKLNLKHFKLSDILHSNWKIEWLKLHKFNHFNQCILPSVLPKVIQNGKIDFRYFKLVDILHKKSEMCEDLLPEF